MPAAKIHSKCPQQWHIHKGINSNGYPSKLIFVHLIDKGYTDKSHITKSCKGNKHKECAVFNLKSFPMKKPVTASIVNKNTTATKNFQEWRISDKVGLELVTTIKIRQGSISLTINFAKKESPVSSISCLFDATNLWDQYTKYRYLIEITAICPFILRNYR